MGKKGVPEWLNSSLWSTPNPPPSPPPIAAVKPPAAPVVEPPPSVPPPEPPTASSAHVISAAKAEIRDPLSSTYGSNSSVCHSDEENGSSSGTSTVSGGGAAAAPAPAPPAAEIISRQAQFLQELSRKVINMGELRRLASEGIPDGGGIRSVVWKLLLGYLPPDRSLWPSELAKKRSQYEHFKEDLLINPSDITRRLEMEMSCLEMNDADGSPAFLSRSELSHGEHPLSLGKNSIWNQFFQDAEIVEQIDRDVKRTHPDMHFFSGDSALAKSNQEALRTILIVFAKLNPGIRYVQGMNEILAPLFYVFKSDSSEEYAAAAEADTFFCFVELLSGFRDNFVQQLDNSVVGIRSTITRLSQLLKEHDEELWRHLEMTTKIMKHLWHSNSHISSASPCNDLCRC